jgi:hypothetical protein
MRRAILVAVALAVSSSAYDTPTSPSNPPHPGPGASPGTLTMAAGQTVQATIFGDSHLAGEDDTGARCDHKACLLIRVTSPPGMLEARLRWASPNNALGLFLSTGFFEGEGACCSSELVARVAVRGGETLAIVSLERSDGVTPAQNARQTFELSMSLVPQ